MALSLQLIDKDGYPIAEPVVDKWDYIDPAKQHEMLMKHFEALYPGKKLVDIEPEETRWRLIDEIKDHLKKEHFQEIRRDFPIRVAEAKIQKATTVVAIRDEQSGKVFPLINRSCVEPGDIMAVRIKLRRLCKIVNGLRARV